MDYENAIAVVGMAARLPGAPDMEALYHNLSHKVTSITEVPPERWDPTVYYDEDPNAPDKTYSKIGGFIDDYKPNLRAWRIPPKVASHLDTTQILAMDTAHRALEDAGYDPKHVPGERVGVILGNAMGGDLRDLHANRVAAAEFMAMIESISEMDALDPTLRAKIFAELRRKLSDAFPPINEDSMAGQLSNVVAGRVAAAFKLGGPNYTVDAACASSLAALSAAIHSLHSRQSDMVLTGGVDRNMSAPSFIKFCKTKTLSPDQTCPFDASANGFVMAEGAGILVLKRLEDALSVNDRIRALILGVGSSSDAGAKSITAPNPKGQILCMKRGYEDAGVSPTSVGFIEAHATSTVAGDAAEVITLKTLFDAENVPAESISVSSIKSNIGHLKSGAGAASLVKAILSLEKKVLFPSANYEVPNPTITEALQSGPLPFRVQKELEEWKTNGSPRRAGVSAFGFGGTNFHVVLEESPADLAVLRHGSGKGAGSASWTTRSASASAAQAQAPVAEHHETTDHDGEPALVTRQAALIRLAAANEQTLVEQVRTLREQLEGGMSMTEAANRYGKPIDHNEHRLCITATDKDELTTRLEQVEQAITTGKGKLKLAGAGTYLGQGDAQPVGFLFPGQGSQYVGMLSDLYADNQVVRDTLDEADRVMQPMLGRKLSDYTFGHIEQDADEPKSAAEQALKQTAVTQPAVLATDVALLRILERLGIRPTAVAGHSLGEYGACVAAGVLEFDQALRIVAARGKEMADAVPPGGDPGLMAVVAAPADKTEALIARVDGYVIAANKNSSSQTVIAGASEAVRKAIDILTAEGIQARTIPVSHAFHSSIVAAASKPLRKVLEKAGATVPKTLIFSNVTAKPYPTTSEEIVDLLAHQVASPVEFIAIVNAMYETGVRIFVELGPKRALTGFVRDILTGRPNMALHTNHPKKGDWRSLVETIAAMVANGQPVARTAYSEGPILGATKPAVTTADQMAQVQAHEDKHEEEAAHAATAQQAPSHAATPIHHGHTDSEHTGRLDDLDVWITGLSVGLPGGRRLFEDDALDRLLEGNNMLRPVPENIRKGIVGIGVERLNKTADGRADFMSITDPDQVMTWAGQAGEIPLTDDYPVPSQWDQGRDDTTRMAVAAAYEAITDAWLPLVEQKKALASGRSLTTGWKFPKKVGAKTGVIMASAFPGYNRLMTIMEEVRQGKGIPKTVLLQILGLGHAHIAELLDATGPNLLINAACASTTAAVGVAQDWINAGRCERVIVVGAESVTSPEMMPWIGGGFLSVGAATTEKELDRAAIPFGEGRNGMILASGAVGLVLEKAEAAKARGVGPLAHVVATKMANSAAHPMRLKPEHIAEQSDELIEEATRILKMDRAQLASDMVFMSHETHTPARGGSAQAEAQALRTAFGEHARNVLVVNTKGYTGHPMAAGFEDAVVVAGLWKNKLPSIANLHSPDPEFADLTFHPGGPVNRSFAFRLAAGFGSQLGLAIYARPEITGPRVDEPVFRTYLKEVYGVPSARIVRDHRVLKTSESPKLADRTDALTDALEQGVLEPGGHEVATTAHNELQATATQTTVDSTTEPATAPTDPVHHETVPSAQTEPVTADEVLARLTAVVAERTGYDPEELESDLELEADLGIDTVKQAEIVSQLRSDYHLTQDQDFRLADHPTLQALADYIVSRIPASTKATAAATETTTSEATTAETTTSETTKHHEPQAAAAPATSAQTEPVTADEVLARLTAVVADRTGYDPEELESDLELEADLGIDTVKQAEIVSQLRSDYHLTQDQDFRLADHPTLQALADYIVSRIPASAQSTAAATEATTSEATESETTTHHEPQAVAAPATSPQTEPVTADEVLARLTAVVADRTGYD
ncbi:MAG: acyltransferase domain-containing protein, partial [Deltaproteobacteria bacterium]|nr:acyltransferase domain-containing protein [Deltaproteobacteria bacterium]